MVACLERSDEDVDFHQIVDFLTTSSIHYALTGIPQDNIDDKGYWDSGCSRHMTGNISYLSKYEPYNGGYVSFGHGGGMITNKGHLDTEICIHGLLKNIVPHKNLTCLIAKASEDESKFDVKGDEENQPIKKGTGPNWLFDIDSLTKSMNYVPVVVAGTSSTNISGTKEDALKENVSSLRYIALPNWFHEAQMATSNDSTRNRDAFSEKGDPQNKQDKIINTYVSESSGNTNPTAITKDPTAEQVEPVLSSTVETEVPTVSTPVPTECLSIPPVERFLGDTPDSVSSDKVEANLSNMETDIQISPTPTLRIHKVHPKS
ncbi:hypothetical protein Tco_0939846 [Tanacetum coccineum]|uniref:Retrovirus-related Pol polyprotein from transposon TNT 1-94-like beta-barrel domain-containing protein n=1 Tax=Tanacetum coccineum TaxID=301880 RepID=A0ABQ5DL97_9ASTR